MKRTVEAPHKTVGILGGGQLGCMLADAALELGLSPRIYAEGSSPAAALFPDRVTLGAVTENDQVKLRDFLSSVTHVAFENEFLDTALLENISNGLAVKFGPDLQAIHRLQDKLRQKELFQRLGLPTAPFVRFHSGSNIHQEVEAAFARFKTQGVVFKWSRLGYDGKGVLLAKDTIAGHEEARMFCETSLARGVSVYAEERIAFRREMAMVSSFSVSGEFADYPLVLSEQEHGICRRVLGPATALGVPVLLESEARDHAHQIAKAVGLTGTFALELFETNEGKLTINEIAPRVHNSGHYTQDACPSSQFENHWRGILGLPLGDSRPMVGGFGMLNLLGPEDLSLKVPQTRHPAQIAIAAPPLNLHWYAKSEVRPWRKLGHVNGVVASASEIPQLEKKIEQYHLEWKKLLK